MHACNVFGELLSLHFDFVHCILNLNACFPSILMIFFKSNLYQIHIYIKVFPFMSSLLVKPVLGMLVHFDMSFCLHKMHFFHHHTLQVALH